MLEKKTTEIINCILQALLKVIKDANVKSFPFTSVDSFYKD